MNPVQTHSTNRTFDLPLEKTSKKEGSSYSHYLRDSLYMLGATGLNALAGRTLYPYLTSKGLCFEKILTPGLFSTLEKINHLVAYPREKLAELMHFSYTQQIRSIGPVIEELQFRGIFQQILLKKIPETLLHSCFPGLHIDFDSLPSKLIRIIITTTLFTLVHLQYASCDSVGGLTTFIEGLIFSGVIESGYPLVTSMILHMLWNQYTTIIEPHL